MPARGSRSSWSPLQGSASCSSLPRCNRRGSRCIPGTSITTRCTISSRRWPCGSSFLACGGSMLTRREFLEAGTAIALAPYGCGERSAPGVVVHDFRSQLNATRVHRVVQPASADAVVQLVRSAAQEGRALSIAGGRHAMGGQQFGSDTTLVDMGSMQRVLGLDAAHGLIDVEAGIEWPELMRYLVDAQQGAARAWGIRQKQTGADRLSIGGALAANAHGRGLNFKPFIGDVESFVLVDADGIPRTCSRAENAELFRLAIGGYGLFGVITSVRLRLAPRVKVQRQVQVLDVDELMPAFEQRIAAGFTYGACQYPPAPDPPERSEERRGGKGGRSAWWEW